MTQKLTKAFLGAVCKKASSNFEISRNAFTFLYLKHEIGANKMIYRIFPL